MMFEGCYKNKKVLVTGHTGFKGSWLTLWLNRLGANVIGVSDKVPTIPSHFESLDLKRNIKHYFCDVRDYESLKKIFLKERPEIIFHLAAQPLVRDSYRDPHETFTVNAMGTLNVAELVRTHDFVSAGIFITSDKAYKNVEWKFGYRETDVLGGDDPYSGSKGAAELILNSYVHSFFGNLHSPKIGIGRAGNVIGGGDWARDRIVPDAINSWRKGATLEVRSPRSTRPWQHVLEPLSGYLTLGQHIIQGREISYNEAFNFGPKSEVNKTVAELLDEMSKYFSSSFKWSNVEIKTDFVESGLLKLCCDKAHIDLNWFPTLTFQQTIELTSNWYRAYFNGEDVFQLSCDQINFYENQAKILSLDWAK